MSISFRLDLTDTRAEGDRKEYRLIQLSNGLECLLVSTFSEQQQNNLFRRPSSGNEEREERKVSSVNQERRFTQEFSRNVRSISEERWKKSSDLSIDSPISNTIKTRGVGEDDVREFDEEEERKELVDGIASFKTSPAQGPNKSTNAHLSYRDSSSKTSALGGVPSSQRPSFTGVYSGDVGRKLSHIYPSQSILQQQQSNSELSVQYSTNRLGRTSVIESPRERPPALRLSRMLGTSQHLEITPSKILEQIGPESPSSQSLLSFRTHRTSVRSSIIRSSFAYPNASIAEPDMCAIAMGISVGSFATPDGLDGLAHFLEHMLFMGSEKHPKENEFDSLLARAGGSSNAYTDTERTIYHFSVPLPYLKECLRVFAQFFVSPLLLPEASDRELNSIEAEFALRQNIDGCRLQEIWRETSRLDTPYAKFTCGNLETLKKIPEKKGIEVNQALREFHGKYYVTGNMKFVIVAGDPLSDLEASILDAFRDVRAGPQEDLSISEYGFPWKNLDPLKALKDQNGVAAGCCFRIPPTHDMHEIQFTWQLENQAKYYKSKPTDFVAHLLGHESQGSILAELKARGWATALMAGVSVEDGFTNNTGVTLFNVTVSLTSAGLSQWVFVAGILFEFIGILKRTGPIKWVHDELRDVASMQYRFHEEPDARLLVQRLCVNMLPQNKVEKENLLNCSSLLFEWNPEAITKVLDKLEAETVRVDLISSRLNENTSTSNDEFVRFSLCEKPARRPIFERFTGATYWMDPIPPPIVDSWKAVLCGKSTVGYTALAGEETFPRSLGLPPRNPFISSDFHLKTIRQYEYSEHFLVGGELRVKQNRNDRHVSFGKRISYVGWEMGVVLAYDRENDSVLVKYSAKEGVRKWHRFDHHINASDFQKNKIFTADYGKSLIKFTSSLSDSAAKKAEAQLKANQNREDYDDVAELFAINSTPVHGQNTQWASFPRIPSVETAAAPTLVAGSDDFFSLWYLHDTTFRSPRVQAYLNFLTPVITESAQAAALADLFALLVFESLNQESYMAYIVDLNFEIEVTGGLGIQLHFSGFSHKLPDLLKIVLRRTFFFSQWVHQAYTVGTATSKTDFISKGSTVNFEKSRKSTQMSDKRKSTLKGDTLMEDEEFESFYNFFLAPDQDAPRNFDTPIFYARLETLLFDYINASSRFRSGPQVSSVLFDLLCDGLWTPEEKSMAAKSITPSMLVEFAHKIFANCKVEGLFQGNVDEKDASSFFKCVDAALKVRGSKPIRPDKEPRLRCQVVPVVQEKNQPVSGWIHILEAVESPSHSVELFFQIGPENPEDRVLANVLEQLMAEPLYSELRTKQQLGYSVKCGVRSVCGTLGFVVEITSDVHGPELLAKDIDDFFTNFKKKLEQMPQEEYVLNLCGLAAQFLEKPRNLGEAALRHWNCILSNAFYGLPYVWNSNLLDAALIKAVASKSRVLDCFSAWLDPLEGKRRRASVYVIGYGYDVEQLIKRLKKPYVKVIAHPHGAVVNTMNNSNAEAKKKSDFGGDSSRRGSTKCVAM